MPRIRFNLDALGVCASTLCMLHCLVLPLLLAVLPWWSARGDAVADGTDRPLTAGVASLSAETTDDCCPAEQTGSDPCCPAGTDSPRAATASTGADPAANQPQAVCCSNPVDYWVHVGLLATVAPLGLVAWGFGYRTHRSAWVLGLGLTGVTLLIAALTVGIRLFGPSGEQILTVTGSICMVTAHLWNRRQCRCCRTADLDELVQLDGGTNLSAQHCPSLS